MDDDGEIGKVTTSDSETLQKKTTKELRGNRGKGRNYGGDDDK